MVRQDSPQVGKLCTDGSTTFTTSQLIGKVVALLREADPDKFDDAVAQAKNQLTTEQKQAKRNDLEKLFDAQIATLKDRGTPKQIVEILQNQKRRVLAKASEMTFGDSNIQFLPVIPRTFRSPYDLMAMVRNGGKAGYTYLNPTQISDVMDAPQELYYIYDVEDGSSTRGKSPENAHMFFQQQRRSALTAAEVTALTTHMDVLSKHCVLATGSRLESADKVPILCLDGFYEPMLTWSCVGFSNSSWGSPSCGSR